MVADAIRWILTNLPLLLCCGALLAATVFRKPAFWPERYLSWILLLAVGVDGIWAGIFHVFLPDIASRAIGWQPSPFEFEVGIADMSIGIVALLSFWQSLDFKRAAALYALLFFGGVTIGHIIQAVQHDDYAPDNFGLLLALTIARALALAWLLWLCRPSALATRSQGK